MDAQRTARLELHLLGTFQAVLDGAPLDGFRSNKVRALLAYLAVEQGRPHLRDALATLLWGEYAQRDAQRSLSQALTNLRRLLAPLWSAATPATDPGETSLHDATEPLLTISGHDVTFDPRPAQVWVDLHAFDGLLAAADPRRAWLHQEPDPAKLLAQAVTLYRGPFLAGLSLPASPGFEEWCLLHQEQRHQAVALALERLVRHHLAARRTDEVQRYARQRLALEPWSEGAHQSLMLALALEGQRGAALRQYETCQRVLEEELGAEPSAETEALARQIRARGWSEPTPQASKTAAGPVAPPRVAFVARERELARLERFLDLALAGQGRAALVSGETGTGKTALLTRFAQQAVETHRELVVAGGQCSARAGMGDPFLPFREILQTLCGETEAGWAGDDGNPEHARRLGALFPRAAAALVDVAPEVIGRFVSAEGLAARAEILAPPGAPWRAQLANLLTRARTGWANPPQQEPLCDQLTRLLRTLALQQPLLLLLDDLQWADAASLSLLFHLGQRLAGSGILVAGAYRPSEVTEAAKAPGRSLAAIVREFGRQWGEIGVDLDRAGGRHFVDALLDSEPNRFGDCFRETLARHTDGNALFTIELLRAFQERGDIVHDQDGRWVEGPTLHWETLPPRVEAVIAERMDRLPRKWRRMLDVASVEGETFSAEVVARALDLDANRVRQGLSGPLSLQSKLVVAVGIERLTEGGEPLSRYRFSHSMLREYLYGQLDPVQQAHLHGVVAEALEGLCQGDQAALAQVSAQLARHYERAKRPGIAAHFLLLAGRQACLLSACEEAIALYQRGLALLGQVPETAERARRQIELYLALDGPPYLGRGWGVPERVEGLAQAYRLALRLGDPRRILRVLLHLTDAHSWLSQSEQALEYAEELLCRAQQAEDPFYLAAGHLSVGVSHVYLGDLMAAREHLERALAASSGQRPAGSLLLPDVYIDPDSASLSWLSIVLWLMGYPDQGLARSRHALARVEGMADPLMVSHVLLSAGLAIHALRRDPAAAQSAAERLRELGGPLALPRQRALPTFYMGWAQAERGELAVGIEAMQSALATMPTGRLQVFRLHLHCLLAEVYLQAGQAQAGLELLNELPPYAGRLYEAEVQRVRGELLLAARPEEVDEAEACFRHALEAARRKAARSLELRAAMSLARLWQAQGRRDKARTLLANVYGWFSEGFDTPDLIEARALLEQLN